MSNYRTAVLVLYGQTTARIDDVEFDTRVPVFGRPAKVIIGVVVFALGVLVGAGLAAWVVPPS